MIDIGEYTMNTDNMTRKELEAECLRLFRLLTPQQQKEYMEHLKKVANVK